MEIKATDLRYGNKLIFLGQIQTFEFIDQIREDGIFWIQTKEQKIAHKNFQFKPIPLTEEILLKCPNDLIFPEWIKFLHDLQNWYFYNNNKKELDFKI